MPRLALRQEESLEDLLIAEGRMPTFADIITYHTNVLNLEYVGWIRTQKQGSASMCGGAKLQPR